MLAIQVRRFLIFNGDIVVRIVPVPIVAYSGCPYQCAYCSTSRFWGHHYRMKSVPLLLEQIRTLLGRYGKKSVEIIQDNFTSSIKYCRDFCKAVRESDMKFTWGCSARIDVVNRDMATDMAAAGCRELFFGIESGSPKIQSTINKRLDPACIVTNAEAVADAGITYNGSFIAGFPGENLQDLRQTLTLMFELRYAADKRNFTHLHLLCPLPGTNIYRETRHQLEFDGLPSDISICILTEKDKIMIRDHPAIFSAFYGIRNEDMQRNLLRRIYLIINFLMELPFTTFLLWKREQAGLVDMIIHSAPYLESDDTNIFSSDRVSLLNIIRRFLEDKILPRVKNAEGLHDLLRYECIANQIQKGQTCIEVFSYDVEEYIAQIRQKNTTRFPLFSNTPLSFSP